MAIKNRQEPFLLFLGDLCAFLLGLDIALYIRFRDQINWDFFLTHLLPFSFIFAISTLVFLVAGLYEKHTSKLQSRVPTTLLYAQIANALLSTSFFYLLPFFGITPRTTLFLYLVISTILLFLWRIYGSRIFALGEKERLILIGDRNEINEIAEEIKSNDRYGVVLEKAIDIERVNSEEVATIMKQAGTEKNLVIVADSSHPTVSTVLARHYDYILSYVEFLDIHQVYEQIFDRVPLTAVNYSLLSEANSAGAVLYDGVKRLLDIVVSVILLILTLPLFPLVAIFIKLDSKGPIMIVQRRVGKRGRPIDMYKFRTMTASDDGAWLHENKDNHVTKVGYILRKSRIDELPQLVNVIKGDISLIGPRPDIVGLGEKLLQEIPYYMTRYTVPPGLSGWAQIQQKPPQSLSETELRFSYDLFYVKNRSLLLDLRIALRTLKTLLSRTGM